MRKGRDGRRLVAAGWLARPPLTLQRNYSLVALLQTRPGKHCRLGTPKKRAREDWRCMARKRPETVAHRDFRAETRCLKLVASRFVLLLW
jgi:hypothetical protein